MTVKPLAVDLFSGAGGATEGLKQAGFKVVAAVENDPAAANSYRANHPEVTLLERDVTDVEPADLGLADARVSLLKACPPCQGYSSLGGNNLDDPRNELISELGRFLHALRPDSFVVENVPGIRSDHRLLSLIRAARGGGYGVRTYEVNAADFGVPQQRRRHIVLGVRGVTKQHLPPRLLDEPVTQTVAGVFDRTATLTSTADPVHRHRALRPKTLERLRAIPVSGNRFDLPAHLQLPCHRRLGSRDATGPYGRVNLSGLAPTMTTRCTTPSCGQFVHPSLDRGLTLREAALIQTFPPRYRFEGGYGSIERQIGNAVPVEMARLIGRTVLSLVGAGHGS